MRCRHWRQLARDTFSDVGGLHGFTAIVALGICQAGIADTIPAINPAANSLFVSVPGRQKTDEYLATLQDRSGDKVANCLVRVHADGVIERQYCTEPYKSAPSAIHSLRDYRDHKGEEWFFNTHVDATGTAVVESCVINAQHRPENCFSMKWLDPHDMLFADNGDRIYMFYVPRAKSAVWFSGKALDLVLRRINSRNEVVWEWSSADHAIADVKDPPRKKGFASEFINSIKLIRTSILTNLGASGDPICIPFGANPKCLHMHWVDYLHANGLAWDRDGGIIVSVRHASEVFKIDYPGGQVAWIFGGYGAQHSDFKLVDDADGFSFQHSPQILPNGNLLLYDNANGRPNQRSRAVEYKFDMDRKTATQVWSYTAPEDFGFRDCCGLVQRLKNGNTLIAWGGLGDKTKTAAIPVATEVTPDGKIAFELRSTIPALPYRVWKQEK